MAANPTSDSFPFRSLQDSLCDDDASSPVNVIHSIGRETMHVLRKVHDSSQQLLAARSIDASAPDERTSPSIYSAMGAPTRVEGGTRLKTPAHVLPVSPLPVRSPVPAAQALRSTKQGKRARKAKSKDSLPRVPRFHSSSSIHFVVTRPERPRSTLLAMVCGAALATVALGGVWALFRAFF